MGYVSVRGITIHSIPYKEKDKILIIFTDKLGKIRAKMRSVRSSNSKRSGLGDEFLYETMLLYKKGSYYTVTEVKLNSAFLNAKSNMESYFLFSYIKELIVLLTGYEQSDMRIFNLVLDVLLYADYGLPVKTLTLYFVLHFLLYSGNPIQLVPENFYGEVYFSPKEDGFNYKEGVSVNREYVETVRYLYNTDIAKIHKVKNESNILELLNNFIYYHTESKHFLDFLETIRKLDNI
jgi:DNA repair protein RecO